MGNEQVSLHRDPAGMINGAHTFHTWTIWKTKLPAGTCFFSAQLSIKHKNTASSTKLLTALRALCTDLFPPQNHRELFQFLSRTRPEAKLRCNTWEGPSHETAIPALPSTLHLQWQWLISPCCHSISAEMPLISNTICKQVFPLHLPPSQQRSSLGGRARL